MLGHLCFSEGEDTSFYEETAERSLPDTQGIKALPRLMEDE